MTFPQRWRRIAELLEVPCSKLDHHLAASPRSAGMRTAQNCTDTSETPQSTDSARSIKCVDFAACDHGCMRAQQAVPDVRGFHLFPRIAGPPALSSQPHAHDTMWWSATISTVFQELSANSTDAKLALACACANDCVHLQAARGLPDKWDQGGKGSVD